MKNEYLSLVSSFLKNKRSKPALLAELEAHIEDKIAFYEEQGKSREEAEKLAVEAMGEPEQTAVSLNSLHNEKWYQNPFNLGVLLYCAISLFLILSLISEFRVCLNSRYADRLHITFLDFVSVALVGSQIIFLILADKLKSRFAVTSFWIYNIALVFISYISSGFDSGVTPCMEYIKPVAYFLMKLFTSPFMLFDSLVSIDSLSPKSTIMCGIIANSISLLFIIRSLLTYFKIRADERMQSCKMYKIPFRIFNIALSVVCSVCVVITSAGIGINRLNAEQIEYQNRSLRADMIDFILSADFSKTQEELTKDFEKSFSGHNFLMSNNDYTNAYIKYNNKLSIEYSQINAFNYMSYERTTESFGSDRVTRYKPEQLLKLKKGTTLNCFKNEGFAYESKGVYRDSEKITFVFEPDNEFVDYDSLYSEGLEISFSNEGRLVSNTSGELLKLLKKNTFYNSLKPTDSLKVRIIKLLVSNEDFIENAQLCGLDGSFTGNDLSGQYTYQSGNNYIDIHYGGESYSEEYEDSSELSCDESEFKQFEYGKTTLEEFVNNSIIEKCNGYKCANDFMFSDVTGEEYAVIFTFTLDGEKVYYVFKNGILTSQSSVNTVGE